MRSIEELERIVKNREVISISYHGSERELEPHALARYQTGELILLGWQVEGPSGSGWRDFRVDGITSVKILGATFSTPRPGFDPTGAKFQEIIFRCD